MRRGDQLERDLGSATPRKTAQYHGAAWRRTVSGWCFAICSADGPPPVQWEFDGPEPPSGLPGKASEWDSRPFADEGLSELNWSCERDASVLAAARQKTTGRRRPRRGRPRRTGAPPSGFQPTGRRGAELLAGAAGPGSTPRPPGEALARAPSLGRAAQRSTRRGRRPGRRAKRPSERPAGCSS